MGNKGCYVININFGCRKFLLKKKRIFDSNLHFFIILISDVEGENVQHYLTDGRKAVPVFEPFFCILRQDLKTFTCHRSEEVMRIIVT